MEAMPMAQYEEQVVQLEGKFFFRSFDAVLFISQLYRLSCITTIKECPLTFGMSFHITGSGFPSQRLSNDFQSFARLKTRPQLNRLGLSMPPTS